MAGAAPAAVIAITIPPGYDKAVAKRRNRRLGLGVTLPGIDLKLVALLRARIIKALSVDIGFSVICPDNHKPAISKLGDRRIRLRATLIGRIDQELVDLDDRRINRGRAVLGRKDLAKNIVTGTAARSAGAALVTPGDNKSVIMRRYRRVVLGILLVGVNQELIAKRLARRIKPLTVNSPIARVLRIAMPGHHKAVVFKDRNRRLFLVVIGVGVDLELIAHLQAGFTVDLPEDIAMGVIPRIP